MLTILKIFDHEAHTKSSRQPCSCLSDPSNDSNESNDRINHPLIVIQGDAMTVYSY